LSARSSSCSSGCSPINHRALVGLTSVVKGCGRNGMVRSVTTICPRVGPIGAEQADHRRQRLVGIAGGKHDSVGGPRPAASKPEFAAIADRSPNTGCSGK